MTGCSAAKDEAASTSEGGVVSEANEKTDVVFWTSMSGGMGETVDKIVKDYNESQDKVHVTVEFQGNYYDMAAKLQTGEYLLDADIKKALKKYQQVRDV